jgi:benzodiazapine receptor
MHTMRNRKTFNIVVAILICLAVGFLSGIVTAESVETWYRTLAKPSFNPPNWIFAPVWTVLYIMMGISAGLIYNKGIKRKEVVYALKFFLAQLILNGIWSILFFGFQSPFIAFVEVVFLWVVLLFTIIYFYRIHRPAAYLLVPYMLWISFASVLNFSIWILNM